MSELSEDEVENFSAHVTRFEQQAYIKIEILCGNYRWQVPIIHTLSKAVCGSVTLGRSTVQQWHKRFREGGVSTKDSQ